MQPLWFKAKRYGWGWYPCTWQGWAVLFLAMSGIASVAMNADATSHSASDTLIGSCIPTVAMVGLLLIICALTGEKPRWRWGGK
jgi:hypothetical protein